MQEAPISEEQAPVVRYLKVLVTSLTVTMIAGFLVLVAVVVMRFRADTTTAFPTELSLPAGATASAVTRGKDWIGVVTADGRILIYDLDGKTLRQEITITPQSGS